MAEYVIMVHVMVIELMPQWTLMLNWSLLWKVLEAIHDLELESNETVNVL